MAIWPPWFSLLAQDMFRLSLPVAEKILRPVIVYGFLVVALRIFGKRELAQLNPFDLVVLLTLSNTVQNAIIGEDNSVTGGLVGAFTLLAVNYLVVRFLFRHRRLDQILAGEPTVLIEHGQIDRAALTQELLTEWEFVNLSRTGRALTKLHDIRRCVLEPGGTFFMEGKTPRADVQRHTELMNNRRSFACRSASFSKALLRDIKQVARKVQGLFRVVEAVVEASGGTSRDVLFPRMKSVHHDR